MIITKTIRSFRRRIKSWDRDDISTDMHNEVVIRETFYFLIIPFYTRTQIVKSQLWS